MQNSHFRISYTITIILVGVVAFYLGFMKYDKSVPLSLYQVYLDGEVIGVVDNIEIPADSLVVTSGLGNIFPSGILIGKVSVVTTDNLPAASAEALFEVLAEAEPHAVRPATIDVHKPTVTIFLNIFFISNNPLLIISNCLILLML